MRTFEPVTFNFRRNKENRKTLHCLRSFSFIRIASVGILRSEREQRVGKLGKGFSIQDLKGLPAISFKIPCAGFVHFPFIMSNVFEIHCAELLLLRGITSIYAPCYQFTFSISTSLKLEK